MALIVRAGNTDLQRGKNPKCLTARADCRRILSQLRPEEERPLPHRTLRAPCPANPFRKQAIPAEIR